MRLFKVWLMVFVMIAVFPVLAQNGKTVNSGKGARMNQKLLDEGDSFYKQEDYQKAADTYQKVLGENPGFASAWRKLGGALARLEQKPQAIAALEKAIQLNPYDTKSLHMLCILYSDVGDTHSLMEEMRKPEGGSFADKKIIEYSQKIIDIDPTDLFAYTLLSVGYTRAGKRDEAVNVWSKGKDNFAKQRLTACTKYMEICGKQSSLILLDGFSQESPQIKTIQAEINKLDTSAEIMEHMKGGLNAFDKDNN